MAKETANTIVITTQLGEVRGVRQDDTLQFRSLPYAQPPVGDLRFLPPRKPASWAGTLDATQFPNRCIQPPDGGIFGQPVGKLDEDCLYLNIVTPSVEGAHRPVLFWIHGGGFTQGSANGYDGSVLATQGDVVVVTINYRLGLLGFLDLAPFGDAYSGSANNGIRDQVFALRWVQDNIADFGGDASNVTIFGESAGGASVLTLLATPSADGLYHKAIAHSPGATDTESSSPVSELVEHLTAAEQEVVSKLTKFSTVELLALQEKLPGVGAAIDHVVVTRSPSEAIKDRGKAGVPLIAGTNRDEGTLFSALFAMFLGDPSSMMQGIAQSVTAGMDPKPFLDALATHYETTDKMVILERVFDAMFLKAAIESVTQATQAGQGGWLYQFDYATTKPLLGRDLGATHAAEIPFTFNRFNSKSSEQIFGYDHADSVAAELAQRWSDTVIQFAKTGEPNGAGLPAWPKYEPTIRETMVLDETSRIERDLNRDLRQLWEGALADQETSAQVVDGE